MESAAHHMTDVSAPEASQQATPKPFAPFDPKPRVILNTDAKTEVDDQFAIVHTLLTPRFDIRGIVPAHFGFRPGESGTPLEDSRAEVDLLLDLMDLSGKVRVENGSPHALADYRTPAPSPGAELIVEEAMREDTDAPLYVAFLGPLTDMASALLTEPRIAERDVTVVWTGGPPYDGRPIHYWPEYNLSNDVAAANVVFSSGVKVWQIPMSVYVMTSISLVELEERVEPCGKIGRYLARQLLDQANELEPSCDGFWLLGDQPVIGVMINAFCGTFRERPAPEFRYDCSMDFSRSTCTVRAYENVDMRFVYEDFFLRLRKFARAREA
jgi:inosine-uridine nucleoside N-ribohydrolase